jgi:hypothetical protein
VTQVSWKAAQIESVIVKGSLCRILQKSGEMTLHCTSLGVSRVSRSVIVVRYLSCGSVYGKLTSKCQPDPRCNTEFQEENVEHKLAMVVVCHAVVHPRTVTINVSPAQLTTCFTALTDRSWPHNARTSYSAYCAEVSAPCS